MKLSISHAILIVIATILVIFSFVSVDYIHIQTRYEKLPQEVVVNSENKKLLIEPIPFEKKTDYTFGIRIRGNPQQIVTQNNSLFLPGGEIEFISSTLIVNTIVHANIPAAPTNTLNLSELKRQGSTVRYYHFTLPFALLFLALAYYAYRGYRSCTNQHYSGLFFFYLIFWAAALIYYSWVLTYYHGPDESRRFFSGAWYINHLLPISLDDHYFIEPTWGMNYVLSSPDWGLLFSFKLANILAYVIDQPFYILVRVAQVILAIGIIGLIALIASYSHALLAFGIFAIIPEASYLLTYVTQDGLNLLFCMFALLFAKYGKLRPAVKTAIAGIIILNTRQSYAMISGLCLAYIYLESKEFKISACIKDIPILAIACLVGSYKYIYCYLDQWQHHTSYTLLAMEHATDRIKQSYRHMLYGHIDCSVFHDFRWYMTSFISFFGVYGLMTHVVYFDLIVLVAYMFIILLRCTPKKYVPLLLVSIFLSILGSLLFSATFDYQPQGRILFTFLSVIPCLLINFEKKLVFMVPLGLIVFASTMYEFKDSHSATIGMRLILEGEPTKYIPRNEDHCFARNPAS